MSASHAVFFLLESSAIGWAFRSISNCNDSSTTRYAIHDLVNYWAFIVIITFGRVFARDNSLLIFKISAFQSVSLSCRKFLYISFHKAVIDDFVKCAFRHSVRRHQYSLRTIPYRYSKYPCLNQCFCRAESFSISLIITQRSTIKWKTFSPKLKVRETLSLSYSACPFPIQTQIVRYQELGNSISFPLQLAFCQ